MNSEGWSLGGRLLSGSRDESGASAVEYGLLIAGVAALLVAVVFIFGTSASDLFDDSCGTIAAEMKRTC